MCERGACGHENLRIRPVPAHQRGSTILDLGAVRPPPVEPGFFGAYCRVSASSTEASALEHLEWNRVAERVFAALSSVAASHRLAGDEEASSPQEDAILPRSHDLDRVRRAFDDLRGLEVALQVAIECEDVPHALGPLLAPVLDVVPLLERAARSSTLDVEELCAVQDLVVAADEVGSLFRAAAARLEESVEPQEGDRDRVCALQRDLGPLASESSLRGALRAGARARPR